MGSPFMPRWPEPNTNATEADTTHTLSPLYPSSLFGSPGTPQTNQEQNSIHWSPDPHIEFEQDPTISSLTTPRQRRTSPRKPNTPISRTTPVGSIQKPISSDHLTKNFSILSLDRPRTPTPHSSPTRRRLDTEVDGTLACTPSQLRHGFDKDNVENAKDMVSSCQRSSRNSRFEPYPNTSSPGSERREYRSPSISYAAASSRWQYPFCGYTSREISAMEQADNGTRDGESNPSSGTLTAQDSVVVSSSSSPDAEYTSDSDSTLSSIPPSPQDTSLMSLDQHLCCWTTGDNAFSAMRCGWESLSHEDLWQHVMCEHFKFIEVFQGKLICGWVCEAEGRDGRVVCAVGIGSLEEMREHFIGHLRNEGGMVGGGEDGGSV